MNSSCGRLIPLGRKRQWFQSRWLMRQEAIRARHSYFKQTKQTFTTLPRILTSRLGSQHLRSEDVNVLTLYISSDRGNCSLFIRAQWRSSERILRSYVRRLIQLLHFVYRSCFAVSSLMPEPRGSITKSCHGEDQLDSMLGARTLYLSA